MYLNQTTETFGVDDQSWLGSAHGTDATRSITLDTSAFTANTHYPQGFFKSGIPLAKLSATGLYVPYAGAATEVQTITIDATGGTFTVTFEGGTTAAVAYNATAAQLQAALEALTNVQPGDVAVSKAGSVFTVSFGGKYSGENVTQMTTNAGSLTGGAGTATVATTTAGGGTGSGGSETLVGFLFSSQKAPTDTTIDVSAALLWHGAVRESRLPLTVDAAGKRAVAGRILFV